jgi:hypothetical protein
VAIVMRALASLDVVSAGTSMALLFAAFINWTVATHIDLLFDCIFLRYN